MNFLAIRVGWMKEYKGITQSDYIIGGGKNPEETGRGVEVCNFLTHTDGYVYGNVGAKRENLPGHKVELSINRLGANDEDDFITDIPIFFFGGKQFKGINENRLIGYYKKAIVYRKSQRLPVDMVTHEKNQLKYYRFKAKAEDVVLLKQVDRTTKFSPTTQSQWCFTPKKYINVVKNISFSKGSIEKNSPRKSGRKNTPYLQRIEVERKAVALTITHYEEFGYEYIKSVESENCGYDLEIGKGKGKLCVEVKGRGQQSPDITLTPNEYKYFKERKKNYRLVIVTGCMTDEPKIFICKFKNKKLIVINNQEMSVVGNTVESFRLQIN